MPIVFVSPPNASLQIVEEAVRKRMHPNHGVRALRGEIQIFEPIPVYRRWPRSKPEQLSRAILSAWYYPLRGGDERAFAAIARRRKDRYEFRSIVEGAYPRHVMDALAEIDPDEGWADRSYEVRLLEIPSFRSHALWLHAGGGHDRYWMLPAVPKTKPLNQRLFTKTRKSETMRFLGPAAKSPENTDMRAEARST